MAAFLFRCERLVRWQFMPFLVFWNISRFVWVIYGLAVFCCGVRGVANGFELQSGLRPVWNRPGMQYRGGVGTVVGCGDWCFGFIVFVNNAAANYWRVAFLANAISGLVIIKRRHC